MKKFAISILALNSLSALSCPDLKGTYYCPDNTGNVKVLELSQEVVNGYTNYLFKENQIKEGRWIVDGKLRSLNSSPMDGVSNAKYLAKCHTDKLFIKLTGDLFDFETTINYEIEMSKNQDNNLVQESRGQLADGTPLPNIVTQCYRDAGSLRQK